INSANNSNSGIYTLTVTDANGCSATATTEVVVNAKPSKPTISTSSATVCSGGSAILTASSCDGGQGTLRWTGGLNGTSITISPTNSRSYRVLCVSAAGCESDSSDATLISVVPIPSIPNVSNVVIRVGTSTSLTAICSSGTPVWYASTTATASLGTTTFTTPTLNSNTTYFVACESNPNVNPNCVSSRIQQIVQVDNFAITSQPQNKAICAGQATSFSVSADGTNISYQWQVNNGGGWVSLSNNPTYSGVNLATLSISNVSLSINSYQYRCILTNGLVNGTPATLTSNAASLTVLSTSSGSNLTVTNAINSTNTIIQAGQTITATNSITGTSRVEYLAGNAVLLNPGFVVTAASGSSFQAKVQATCQN
nr:hypothetical protein [Spirosomataceae bacterium]